MFKVSSLSIRPTVLLARPFLTHCRCDVCCDYLHRMIELSIEEPNEPLMIPTFNRSFGWWNVRLPSKSMEPTIAALNGNSEIVYVEEDVMKFLEEKKVINWCLNLFRLHPIHTTGDGNCLMHAVILATCGIQDSGLVLRRLVYVALVESTVNSLRERWKRERERLNESIPGGLQLSPEEWDKEWNLVVSAAEDLRQTSPKYHRLMGYQFLEEMHVFVLANVLRRPIIILGESTVRSPLEGDAIEHNNFVGIYLPLLWRPLQCSTNPIMLCFLMNHFQPLISRRRSPTDLSNESFAIPLVTSRLEPLHIHFLLPEEERCAHQLLQQYLNTIEIPSGGGREADATSTTEDVVLAAQFIFDKFYYEWEDEDYKYLTSTPASMLRLEEVQKIAGSPSKYNQNYFHHEKCAFHSSDTTSKEIIKIQSDIRQSDVRTSVSNDIDRTIVPNNIEIFNCLKSMMASSRSSSSSSKDLLKKTRGITSEGKCSIEDCNSDDNRFCSNCATSYIANLGLDDSLKQHSETRNVKDRSFSFIAKCCSSIDCHEPVTIETDPFCPMRCKNSKSSSYCGGSDVDVTYNLKCRIYNCHQYRSNAFHGFCQSCYITNGGKINYDDDMKRFEGKKDSSSSVVFKVSHDFYLLIKNRGFSIKDARSESSLDISNVRENVDTRN